MRPFRIVVAAHGDLAAALIRSAEMICGPIEDAVPVALLVAHSPEQFAELLRAALDPVDRPALILADLQGGTPHNVACLVARGRPATATIAGVNLGILIEAAMGLQSVDEDAIQQLVSAGRLSIVDSTRRLAGSAS